MIPVWRCDFSPIVLLENNSCDFCQACVSVCPTNALSLTKGNQYQAHAALTDICVKQFNQYCSDTCQVGAITQTHDGIQIDTLLCIGYEECQISCSQQAICMQKNDVLNRKKYIDELRPGGLW